MQERPSVESIQPASGVVLYREPKTTGDGTLDPSYWQGLDAQSQGAVAEGLPQPPQNPAEYQNQVEGSGTSGPGAPVITSVIVNGTDVTWLTDVPATSQAQWDGGGSPVNSDLVTAHAVSLGTLGSGSYTIRVLSKDADGNAATAETQHVVP